MGSLHRNTRDMKLYPLSGKEYEHLPSNDFRNIATGEIVTIFDKRWDKLMKRVEFGVTTETPEQKKVLLIHAIHRSKRKNRHKRTELIRETIKQKEKIRISGNHVVFEDKIWIEVPKNKTHEQVIEKYKPHIYRSL